jgi:hypothetical protein
METIMQKIITAAISAALLAAFSASAVAGPSCTSEPKERWMSEAAMKDRVAQLGYKDIRTFKISGNCYEIYGRGADGRKAEVYFNPVTGEVVKANSEG